MRKIIHILGIILMTSYFPATAQLAVFTNSGKIKFERKVNTFAAMPIFLKETGTMPGDQLTTFMQQYRNTAPQFWTDSFELYFNGEQSFYQPVNPDINYSQTFQIPVAYKNKVYSNFSTGMALTEKQAFEQVFFIKDAVKSLKWKLTEETREIAGYECHRANAVLFDSIYIVAFYTDEIPARGGPESFNGLPGMILGIAIPHQHITIFAQSVTSMDTGPEKWKIPASEKNTPINNKDFNNKTAKMLKQFNLTSPWVQFFMDL